jgi:hypothetical protein
MADRTEDWNALFDPATGVVELQRIATDYPEFAAQATEHANWTEPVVAAPPAPTPPPPVQPPAPTGPPAPVYATGPVYGATPVAPTPVYVMVGPPAPAPVGGPLSGGERSWWVVVAIVWLATYALSTLLPAWGVTLVSGDFDADFLTRLLWVTIGIEFVPFLIAIVAVLVVGRGPGRKLGAVLVLVIGFALVGTSIWWVLPNQFLFAIGAAFGPVDLGTQLLGPLFTVLPVVVEIAVAVIAYTIAGARRWHTLWAIVIGAALLYGAYFLSNLFGGLLGIEIGFYVTVGVGVLVRLIVVIVAGAFGGRRDPVAAPRYDAPTY